MTGQEFQDWLDKLPAEEGELVLIFVCRVVVDTGVLPSYPVGDLRAMVANVYNSRPNKTWTQFMEEIEETAEDKK